MKSMGYWVLSGVDANGTLVEISRREGVIFNVLMINQIWKKCRQEKNSRICWFRKIMGYGMV